MKMSIWKAVKNFFRPAKADLAKPHTDAEMKELDNKLKRAKKPRGGPKRKA